MRFSGESNSGLGFMTLVFALLMLSVAGIICHKGYCSRPAWQKWQSSDGNARIETCNKEYASLEHPKWRPATEEELLKYRNEFPCEIQECVFAGASLYYKEDSKTGQLFPMITGYVRSSVGGGFISRVAVLDDLDASDLQLLVQKEVAIKGNLPPLLQRPECIGGYIIPYRIKTTNVK